MLYKLLYGQGIGDNCAFTTGIFTIVYPNNNHIQVFVADECGLKLLVCGAISY